MNPASPSEKPRWLGYVQLALIVVAIAVALYFAQAPNRVERGPVSGAVQAMPVVSVVKPAATEHVIKVNLTGSVRAERRAKVRSEVVGRVVWVSPDFTEGGTIPANEPFLKIDRREFELEVEAANMAVSEAEAKVGVERALPLDRAGRLPSIAVAEAALGKARAALALAELRLARTEISLPFDARVVSTDVEVGEMVGPASTAGRSSRLGVVYRRGVLKVRAPIEPGDLSRLEPVIGRSALVRTNSGTYEAKVTGTSSVVAAKTRLAALFLEFSDDAPPESLPVPGMFVRVEVVGPKRGNVYVLPESAARENDTLWVVRNGVLTSLEPGTVGRSAEGWIVEAFDSGEGVVVGALPAAEEGRQVEIASVPSSSSE